MGCLIRSLALLTMRRKPRGCRGKFSNLRRSTAFQQGPILGNFSPYTAKTQYRKFETNIPRKGTARPQSHPIPTFMILWAIYIFLWSVCLFCCRKIGGPNVGIYRSLTDTWMWKLGLRPRYSFSGYINPNFFALYSDNFKIMHDKIKRPLTDLRKSSSSIFALVPALFHE